MGIWRRFQVRRARAQHRRRLKFELPTGVTVGRHTYGYDARTFATFTEGAEIQIGAFCSIGPGVRVLGGGEHVTERVTTFPLNTLLWDPEGRDRHDARDVRATVIGNDVWIGSGAIVVGGVTVGDGVVIGAGAVVAKDVPPYAIVVGNPAQVHRYRFEDEARARLLELCWWDWPDDVLLARKEWFLGGVDTFLRESERAQQ